MTVQSLTHPPAPVIAILDSGIGGLTVLQALQTYIPAAQYLYLADHAYFPYGQKSESAVSARVVTLAQYLQAHHLLDLLVLACNTASTVALPALRASLPLPIVGVVPAIKPAAALSRSRVIGLLATDGTIRRPYTDDLISQYAAHCQVIRLGSARLVEMAEEKLLGQEPGMAELAKIVAPFAAHPTLDTVVLACTHFPHLTPNLQLALPHVRHWVDPGLGVARRSLNLLQAKMHPGSLAGPARFISTGGALLAQERGRAYLQETYGFAEFERLEL